MYRGHSVGVVVPAYNEAEHVADVIESLPTYVDRVYAVDDCSTDATWDIIADLGTVETLRELDELDLDDPSEPPDVVPISHLQNQGAGAAIKTGYHHALNDGIDLTVTVDADGQMDPEMMSRLLDPIVEGEAEYAKGNRLASTETAAAMPPVRLLGNWLLTMMTKVSSGYWSVRDTQNGYTAISREALAIVEFEEIPDNHDYVNDLLTRLNVANVRVADVSMPAAYGSERSSIVIWRFIPYTIVTLLRSYFWRLDRSHLSIGLHPLLVVLGLGGLCLVVGTITAVSFLLVPQLAAQLTPLPFRGSVAVTLAGLVTIALGVFFDLLPGDDHDVVHR